MRAGARAAMILAMGASAALATGGCGSQAKTVSVSVTSPATRGTAPATAGAAPTSPASTPAPPAAATQTTSAGSSAAPSSTRAAPEPAFTEKGAASQGAGAEGVSAATALVRARGYTPTDPADYHPNQTLRVLIGAKDRSAGAFDQQAFFFVDGRFIGTDSSVPSATLAIIGQSDTEVTLAYPLYRKSDPVCCPSAGQARVRFQLDNGKLAALDPIPAASSATGLSRQ